MVNLNNLIRTEEELNAVLHAELHLLKRSLAVVGLYMKQKVE